MYAQIKLTNKKAWKEAYFIELVSSNSTRL